MKKILYKNRKILEKIPIPSFSLSAAITPERARIRHFLRICGAAGMIKK